MGESALTGSLWQAGESPEHDLAFRKRWQEITGDRFPNDGAELMVYLVRFGVDPNLWIKGKLKPGEALDLIETFLLREKEAARKQEPEASNSFVRDVEAGMLRENAQKRQHELESLKMGCVPESSVNSAKADPDPASPAFIPTPLQDAILNALDGKALKVEKLAEIVAGCSTTRLYKPGGLKELKAAGLIAHKHGVGYFRPDSPPKNAKQRPGKKQ